MSEKKGLGIILNPAAGREHALHVKNHLIDFLRKRSMPFQLELTNHPGHAVELANRMSKNYETLVAAGGDGTVNEVVSGIVGKQTTIAILPIGSGNDYSKAMGISHKLDQALDIIFCNKRKLMDLGKVIFWDDSGNKKERYFVNTLGMGLDAEIARETKQIKYLRGLPLYLLAALKAIRKHCPNEYSITDTNKRMNTRAFLVCAGNGCFEGGGFKLLPNAKADDGLLDICTLGAMPITKALRILPRLINGKHENLPEVEMWRTKKIKIDAKDPFVLHGDGELFSLNAVKAEISVAKNRISYVTA
ncbi:MAG: diacylglycerol kinase family lipid kinase [Bacteroidetes bacterium]|nr:diacylglycerol kinase family lipid kinase [Bacteroidota bacterium]